MKTTPTPTEFGEFKYGWPVVLAATLGIGLGLSPLPFYTIGVFAVPLTQTFGWGMDTVMSAFPVFTITVLILSPLVGMLADRLGARRVVLASITLFGLAFMLFALNTGSVTLYLLFWVLLAVAGVGTLPMTFTRAVNNWFNRKRGLALGLSLLGTGIFGALAKNYAGWIILNYGWQAAYIGVGLLPLLISLPAAYFFFRDTTDPKVQDKVAALRAAYPTAAAAADTGLSIPEALRDRRFWLMVVAFIPLSFAIGGPIPNLERFFVAKGFVTADAVWIASILGVSVLVGRIIGGYLLDKFWAPAVAFVLLAMPAISCLIFQQDLTTVTALTGVIILGFAAGVEYDLMAYLVSRYFGMKSYSGIYGIIYGFFACGAGFGPYIFARIFEQAGSYDPAFQYAFWAFLLGAVPLLFLGKYRDFGEV